MKHGIIGTAGHVDHGKTVLIKALTGMDTDRLAEEKRRGITIDLGFAHLDWPDGTQAGIVDVPGHEKFIKNMLAGAGGIDLALLVVAADEGVMPQTVEHLDILSLLGIRDGIVVLTKADLADADWLEMIRKQVQELVRGTFLEGAPILPVSAVTGSGISELNEQLHSLVLHTKEKSTLAPFRLPIDRVFSVDGFGTVVTGTLTEGVIRVGDPVELTPSGLTSRVRNIQVHGQNTETAYAGQRAALNLPSLKKEELRRGDAAVKPGSVRPSRMLDVRLRCLPDAHRTILSGSQVHLYHGASVQLAKAVLLDRDELPPGAQCFAQLRLTEPLAARQGDRFVIRFYSPLETIGGGVVLDPCPPRRKRYDPAVLESLLVREQGSDRQRLLQAVAGFGVRLPNAGELAGVFGLDVAAVPPIIAELVSCGQLAEPLPGRYVTAAALDDLWPRCREILDTYHRRFPLHAGIPAAELRQKLFRKAEPAEADALLGVFLAEGRLTNTAGRYALAGFSVRLTKRQTAIREELLRRFLQGGMEPEPIEAVLAVIPSPELETARQVLESLLTCGDLVRLSPELCWHRDIWHQALEALQAQCTAHGAVTLAELRDALGTTRKYALLFLEACDRRRITIREGDLRRLNMDVQVR